MLSNDIESQFDNVWVPNSFVHAESVIDALCPAGPNESQKDFDIALSSASLNYLKGTLFQNFLNRKSDVRSNNVIF